MMIILLTLLLVTSTLFLSPYSPHILAFTAICYFVACIRQATALRKSTELAEGEEEIERKKEYESDFIERSTNTLFHIFLSLLISTGILNFIGDLGELTKPVLLLTTALCLGTVNLLYWRSPHNRYKRLEEKEYRDFCKDFMDARYQEFLREERGGEGKRGEGKK